MSPTPASKYINLCGREIHYKEWSSDLPETVVLWHGLARTGNDFDPLCRDLAQHYRLIVPDTLGRGLSSWAQDAEAEYCHTFYAQQAVELVNALGLKSFRWVGTSMGGQLGMVLAGGLLKDRITHLVVNDVSPEVPASARDRILSYASKPPVFDTIMELEQWLRKVYAPYGWLGDEQWRNMTETSARRTDAGKVTVHYDPRMTMMFSHHPEDMDLWHYFDNITAKMLLLRGETSDILPESLAEQMVNRGPKPTLKVFSNCGHAPALNTPEQNDYVKQFLQSE